MLDSFSRNVRALYRLSQDLLPSEFRSEALFLLRKEIAFDGAVCRFGQALSGFCIRSEPDCSDSGSCSLLEDCGIDSLVLPTSSTFLGLRPTLGYVLWKNGEELRTCPASLANLVSRTGAESLLACAADQVDASSGWLVLYRRERRPFEPEDGSLLRHYWAHLQQSWAMNLSCALHSGDATLGNRSLALVDSNGRVEAADPTFTRMLQAEWPCADGHMLNPEVLKDLMAEKRYIGKQVMLIATAKPGYLFCEAKRVSEFNLLSPGEKKVAYLYATGISYNQIAAQLRVSPFTVRNQLAQIYQKLGIHSKVQLGNIISRM